MLILLARVASAAAVFALNAPQIFHSLLNVLPTVLGGILQMTGWFMAGKWFSALPQGYPQFPYSEIPPRSISPASDFDF